MEIRNSQGNVKVMYGDLDAGDVFKFDPSGALWLRTDERHDVTLEDGVSDILGLSDDAEVILVRGHFVEET